jgi:hypothetical protein
MPQRETVAGEANSRLQRGMQSKQCAVNCCSKPIKCHTIMPGYVCSQCSIQNWVASGNLPRRMMLNTQAPASMLFPTCGTQR